jgi:hypothetical protein
MEEDLIRLRLPQCVVVCLVGNLKEGSLTVIVLFPSGSCLTKKPRLALYSRITFALQSRGNLNMNITNGTMIISVRADRQLRQISAVVII